MFIFRNPNPPPITARTLPDTIDLLRNQLHFVANRKVSKAIAQELGDVTEAELARAAEILIKLTQEPDMHIWESDITRLSDGAKDGSASMRLLVLLNAVTEWRDGKGNRMNQSEYSVQLYVIAT